MKDYKVELAEDELKVLAGVLGDYIAKNEHNEEVEDFFETVRNIFRKVIKSKETLGSSDIHKYSHKLFDAFEKLEFRTTFNKAIQAFYLEEGLYVVRSESMGKYQYTLVKASSEEMAIRKCM